MGAPINEEINFLRFLSRIFCKFTQSSVKNLCEIDSIFDTFYLLSVASTKTDRQNILRILNTKLKESICFCKNEMSIVYLGLISFISQITKPSEININYLRNM